MFDASLIVQSAISSFNNSALSAPTFFWYAIFMLPIFWAVHLFGHNFLANAKFGLLSDAKKRIMIFSGITQVLILLWLILMPGNYSVLRDSQTILPVAIAVIVFLLIISIIHKLKILNPIMPSIWSKITKNKTIFALFLCTVSVIFGFLSGFNTWWGILLQSAAILSGIIVGRYTRNDFEPIKFTNFIILILTAVMLMQPEFFRFGWLGNLTAIHLVFVILIAAISVMIFVLQMIKSNARFKNGFFMKLKWMFRIATIMTIILFAFTESVLVFIGFTITFMIGFAISVSHQVEQVSDNYIKKLWAILLVLFGIITVLPVITIIGILYWDSLPKLKVWDKIKLLL